MANAAGIEGEGSVHKISSSKDSAKGASTNPRITYAPRPDASPQGELRALAAVYAFVIKAHERKKAAATATKRRRERNSEKRRLGRDQ